MRNNFRVYSEGCAWGKVCHYDRIINPYQKSNSDSEEKVRLDNAINSLRDKLEIRTKNFKYFEVQKIILDDPLLLDKIEEEFNNTSDAYSTIVSSFNHFILMFKNLDNDYFRERANDLEDIKLQLLEILTSTNHDFPKSDFILVTPILYPSILLDNLKYIKAVVASNVLPSSHATLFCKEYNIPLIEGSLGADINEVKIDTSSLEIVYEIK